MMPKLAVILKVFERTASLWEVLGNLNAFNGADVDIIALVDPRATVPVKRILNDFVKVRPVHLDFRVVSPEGERFMDANQVALNLLEDVKPDWVYMADDDRYFEPGGLQVLGEALRREDVDVWNIRSLFFWDPDHIREDFFDHNSPLLWRWRPGLRFDPDRTLETPPELYDEAKANGRMRQLVACLYDVGYASPEARQRAFDRYAEAGKIDSLTRSLLDTDVKLRRV